MSTTTGPAKVQAAACCPRALRGWLLLMLGSFLGADAAPFPTAMPHTTTLLTTYNSSTEYWGDTNDTAVSYMGTIPTELGLLTLVTQLDFSKRSDFSGPIPTELGSLTAMNTIFDVKSNKLSSTLPTQLGGAFAAMAPAQGYFWQGFRVEFNSLTGPIPTEYGHMTGIEAFRALNNSLTGQLPTELGLMNGTRNFQIGTNALSKAIPTQLGQLTKIKEEPRSTSKDGGLILVGNDFSAALPTELGRLTKLAERFRLSANKFSSTIPTEIGMLTLATYLNLFSNKLTGILPTELRSMLGIDQTFDLRHNKLCDGIPTQVDALRNGLPDYVTWEITSGDRHRGTDTTLSPHTNSMLVRPRT